MLVIVVLVACGVGSIGALMVAGVWAGVLRKLGGVWRGFNICVVCQEVVEVGGPWLLAQFAGRLVVGWLFLPMWPRGGMVGCPRVWWSPHVLGKQLVVAVVELAGCCDWLGVWLCDRGMARVPCVWGGACRACWSFW